MKSRREKKGVFRKKNRKINDIQTKNGESSKG
jgi:hypothetical protein